MQDTLVLVGIVGFAAGVALYSLAPVPLAVIAFGFFIGLVFLLAWFFGRRDRYLIPALFIFVCALGCLRTTLAPHSLPEAYAPLLDTPVTLRGTIVADPDIRESNQRITVEADRDGVRTRVLAVTDTYQTYSYGERVEVGGTLTLPQPFATDGGRMFEYDAFLAKDGIFALIPLARLRVISDTHNPLLLAQRFLFDIKHAFEHALQDALPEPAASLAAGLIAGGKQGLGKSLLEAFTVTGLLPIIVLSGYNVMIVAEAVLASLRFLPKRFALVLAGVTVALFVLAAGGGASALRAALMAGLALFARATGRTYTALRALAFVFVLMLLINPLLLVNDPGFQFSFAATLGLIVASSSLEIRLRRMRSKVLREVLATTIAAQLFVLPLLLYQTGNLSLVAVVANLLVLPVVPLAMALSALAGVISLLVPAIAPFVGLPAYATLSYIIGVATLLAKLPFAHVIIPAFPLMLVLPPYLVLWWWVRSLKRNAPTTKAAGL
ncbi:MAG: Competence protein ComEC [Parcubacteria group bacterium]|nr:Competence protein ComEC [Parcubacteria group bacterium]